jgi:hypothetical protein
VASRVEQELEHLRRFYPSLEYKPEGQWVRVPGYSTGAGWSSGSLDVVFQIPVGYPGTPPSGFWVPSGLKHNGVTPANFSDPAPQQPPFNGQWALFSWRFDDGQWFPQAEITAGSNLLHWVREFSTRFREGA